MNYHQPSSQTLGKEVYETWRRLEKTERKKESDRSFLISSALLFVGVTALSAAGTTVYLTGDLQTIQSLLATANSQTNLLPHSICLSSEPWLIVAIMAAHTAVAGAYYSIPKSMGDIERECIKLGVQSQAFEISALYRAFILSCAATHAAGVMVLWLAWYQIYFLVLFACAVVSWLTARHIHKSKRHLISLFVEALRPDKVCGRCPSNGSPTIPRL